MIAMNIDSFLDPLLTDRSVTDICIQSGSDVFVDRGNGMEKHVGSLFTEEHWKTWVLERLSEQGKSWTAAMPFCDGVIRPHHRLHVAFPALSSGGMTVSIRALPVALGRRESVWAGDPYFGRLVELVIRGCSVIISGPTGSGKTTLLRDLLEYVPHTERIIALEDTPEIRPHHEHFLSLRSRAPNSDGFGEVTLRDLLKQTLRMRPDRLVLGECRGPEVLDLLQLLNTGHRGAMATLHAHTPRDALRRIELLCLLATNGRLESRVIREMLAYGIQVLVQVERTPLGRKITEVVQVAGKEGETILLRPLT
ncbi:MAG: CpaF family protein [Xanthomonadaceae bacterium]|nr:CpaF family protein [Xanthomonadaceae bacterium]